MHLPTGAAAHPSATMLACNFAAPNWASSLLDCPSRDCPSRGRSGQLCWTRKQELSPSFLPFLVASRITESRSASGAARPALQAHRPSPPRRREGTLRSS